MKKQLRLSILTLAVVSLTACAPRTNTTLERVEARVQAAQTNPTITKKAPAALNDAQEELAAAQRVWERDGDVEETEHRALLAERKLTIAELKAGRELENERRAELARAHGEALVMLRGEELRRARMRSEYFEDETLRLSRELREFRTQRTDRGIEVTLSDVLFETDRAVLKPGAAKKLQPLVAYLRAQPERVVTVEGHTDSSGSSEYNRRLSQERAETVRGLLLSQGIEGSRITAIGFGEQFPVADNETPAGRLQNRRVQIVIK